MGEQTLWCSWVLESPSKKIYFGGDTGYCAVSKECEHPGGDVGTRETTPNGKKLGTGTQLHGHFFKKKIPWLGMPALIIL